MVGASGCIALRELRFGDERLAELFLPRTRTYTLLQMLGLPLLDGCIVLSDAATDLERAAVYMRQYGDSAIVRSDPLARDAPSIRGGDLWPLTRLDAAAAKYLPLRRALLLFEPYNRAANQWSFAILGGLADERFELEIVGPGFDTGHLNRGRVTPHERFAGEVIGRRARVTTHAQFDRARYDADVASAQLPVESVEPCGMPAETLDRVLQCFASVHSFWRGLFVLSGAVLRPGERLVFWDLYDPSQRDR